MYLIALCDDEEADLDKTEQMLRAYENSRPETEFVIERFQSAEHLLRRIKYWLPHSIKPQRNAWMLFC